MHSTLYKVGAISALTSLGLGKYAAIGAKTILPMATELAEQAGKGIKNLQSAGSAAVPSKVLGESPLQQYLAVAGAPQKGESAVSSWVMGNLRREALQEPQAVAARRAVTPRTNPAPSMALSPTLAPPAAATSLAPTLPPPAKLPSV